MKTLVDDGHKYLCFGGDDGLGVKAVQRMMRNATATAAEGTRGDKFVLDKNTGTYSLMKVVAASSSPDTVSLRYLKQGDDHSAPVLTDMCIGALLTVPEIEDVHVRVLEPVRSRTPAYIQFVSVSTC